MNSPIAPKLFSLLSAALVTVTMLLSVNGLATGPGNTGPLAQLADSTPSV